MRTFLNPAYLIQSTDEQGQPIVGQLDKKTVQGSTLTYIFTTLIAKKTAYRTTIRFTINDAENVVTMTMIKFTVPATGQSTSAEYDGTEETNGRILGIFNGVSELLFDVAKINAAGQ